MIVWQVFEDGNSDDEHYPILFSTKERAIEKAKSRYPDHMWIEKQSILELRLDGHPKKGMISAEYVQTMIVRPIRIKE